MAVSLNFIDTYLNMVWLLCMWLLEMFELVQHYFIPRKIHFQQCNLQKCFTSFFLHSFFFSFTLHSISTPVSHFLCPYIFLCVNNIHYFACNLQSIHFEMQSNIRMCSCHTHNVNVSHIIKTHAQIYTSHAPLQFTVLSTDGGFVTIMWIYGITWIWEQIMNKAWRNF